MTTKKFPNSDNAPGKLHTEVRDTVGWLIIDNEAKRNALSLSMWQALPAAIDELSQNPDVRVIVIKGTGERSFCAGADISEFEETRSDAGKARAYDLINVAAFKAIKHAPKPAVAMIRGHCLGGGLGIALACDMRIAADGSVFGIPAARLGLAYPLEAVSDIIEVIGPVAAKRLLFTASRLTTAHAAQIGLVDQTTPEEDLEAEVEVLCRTMSENAPLTLKATKLAINAIAGGGAAEDMAHAGAAAEICFNSADFMEGRNAFLEKRSPRFSGK